MRLLKENKPEGAWWKYDGVNHGLITFHSGVLATLFGLYAWVGTSIVRAFVFLGLELYQEFQMVKESQGLRRWQFSQRRWQDLIFSILGIVLSSVGFLI